LRPRPRLSARCLAAHRSGIARRAADHHRRAWSARTHRRLRAGGGAARHRRRPDGSAGCGDRQRPGGTQRVARCRACRAGGVVRRRVLVLAARRGERPRHGVLRRRRIAGALGGGGGTGACGREPGAGARARRVGRHCRHQDRRAARRARRRRLRGDRAARGMALPGSAADPAARPEPRVATHAGALGYAHAGDLAALPASAVATRLGVEGAALARRARGEDEHPLAPRPLPLHFEETAELDYGVDNLEPFLFVVRGLLDRLLARLALRGLICGDLRLSLGLIGHGRDERTVTVAAPSNELKPLLTLIRLHLEAQPPSAAVETVRLAAVPERLRPMQLDLFRPHGPAPAVLAVTLARLAVLCGTDRLGAPVLADSYRPE